MQQATFTQPNRILFIEGVAYRVEGPTDDRSVLMRQVETGAVKTEAVYNLMTMYLDGRLRVSEKPTKRSKSPQGNGLDGQRIRHSSPAARAVTDRHIAYVTKVKEMNADGAGKAVLEKAIKQIAEERKDKNRPHVSTVYGWLKKFSTDGLSALISRMANKGARRKPKIDPEVSGIVDQKVYEVLDDCHVWTAEEVLNRIKSEIDLKNKFRVVDDQLKEPSLRTVQRRLAQLPQFDVAVAKHGLREAERRFANLGVARRTSRILELVEVDHSPLDLLVVDESGVVVGRPMLTLVLDRFSRCVLGFHLSLDGHGTHSVFAALRHALLPKLYLGSGAYEGLGLAWPCYGWFERLVMDNGREFHAESSVDALLNLGIIGEYAASQAPNDKPHVERVLKTINYSFIHQLPGTTLAKGHQRVGFKSEQEAALTLEQVDVMLHIWILQKYHLRQHKGLNGKTPLQVWTESAKAFPPQLKCNVDDVDVELSQRSESALQHYGIDLNGFRYTSTDLMQLRPQLPKGEKVEVKWPRRDVGYIFVWNRIDEVFVKAFNTDEDFHGLTLEQSKAVMRRRAKDTQEDKAARASATAVIADMVHAAVKDKKLKNRKNGMRLAGKHSERGKKATQPARTQHVKEAPSVVSHEDTDHETFDFDVCEVVS